MSEPEQPSTAPSVEEEEELLAEAKNKEIVGKVATIAVVGVVAAIVSAELIPGMIIGVAAALLPGFGPKLRPLLKSTVKASYNAARKTREMFAEAGESIQDIVAEAKAEEESPASAAHPS